MLYVQYTDPAAYPPLDRSAQLLARAGWDVLFVAIDAQGTIGMKLRTHERIRTLRIGAPSGGLWGAAKYARFALRTALIARRFRPTWCYASDLLSAPAALLVKRLTGARLLYHEHDAPARGGKFADIALRMRARLADRADVVVVPSEERRRFLPAGGARRALVVWNCPLKAEVIERGPPADDGLLRMVYAGSLSPDRLPLTFVDALAALPGHIVLEIYGYATVGHADYPATMRAHAEALGIAERVRFHGTRSHHELLPALRACDIGIATIDPNATDDSLAAMIGASNKTFDYMASGLPFLVTNDPKWRHTFVDPGYAVACRPGDVLSIRDAVTQLLDPAQRAALGARAQARVLDDWNYESQFAPVLTAMST